MAYVVTQRLSSYDLEMRGLGREDAVYVAMTIADRELLWARTGVIEGAQAGQTATIQSLIDELGNLSTDMENMTSDGRLSPVEKIPTWFLFKAFSDERDSLVNQATLQNVSWGTYSSAIDGVRTQMLTGITPGISHTAAQGTITTWAGQDSTISNVTNFRAAFATAGTARAALIAALAEDARGRGDRGIGSGNAHNRNYYTASPPAAGSSYQGYPVIEGDMWFNTDTTTSCPDNNCYGHVLDPTTHNPILGSARAHVVRFRPHRLNSVNSVLTWQDAGDQTPISRSQLTADLINGTHVEAETLNAGHLTGQRLESADYQYTGTLDGITERATRGACIRTQQVVGAPAILASAAGIAIGDTIMSEAWFVRNKLAGGTIWINSSTGAMGILGTAFGISSPVFAGTDIVATVSGLVGTTWGFPVITLSAWNPAYGVPPILGAQSSGTQLYIMGWNPTTGARMTLSTPRGWGFSIVIMSGF